MKKECDGYLEIYSSDWVLVVLLVVLVIDDIVGV